MKTAQKSVKTAVKTSQTAAKTAVKTTQAAQRVAQAARAAAVSAKTAVKAMRATLKAIIAAAKSLISLIAAGGWVAVVVILVMCLAGLLLGSVFGIFFSNESSGGNTPVMTEVVNQLNEEFTAKLEQIQNENSHNTLDLSNNGSSTNVGNWRDILAIYAVKVAADPENGIEVATLDNTKVGILRDVTTTEIILHINVTSKSSSDMIAAYGFNAEQVKMLNELMQDKYQQLFMRLTGSYVDIALSPQEITAIMENLPPNLDEQRKNVVLATYSLVGKVNYFWGGKSTVIGWDSRWGTLTKVTAEGSPTTERCTPSGLMLRLCGMGICKCGRNGRCCG